EAQVRGEDHVLALRETIAGRERLVVVDVERGDAGAALVERGGERIHVDERRARGVGEDRVAAHHRESLGIEQLARGIRWHEVQAHHLRSRKKLLERHGLRAALGGFESLITVLATGMPRAASAAKSSCVLRPPVKMKSLSFGIFARRSALKGVRSRMRTIASASFTAFNSASPRRRCVWNSTS